MIHETHNPPYQPLQTVIAMWLLPNPLEMACSRRVKLEGVRNFSESAELYSFSLRGPCIRLTDQIDNGTRGCKK